MTGPSSQLRCCEPEALVLLTLSPVLFTGALCLCSAGHDFTFTCLIGCALLAATAIGVFYYGLRTAHFGRKFAGGIMFTFASAGFYMALMVSGGTYAWKVELTIQVLDAQSQAPIPGAAVHLLYRPKDISVAAGKTGTDGRARLRYGFFGSRDVSLVCRTGSMHIWERLLVTADGYREIRQPLSQHLGTSWDPYGPPMPIVTVELEKATR